MRATRWFDSYWLRLLALALVYFLLARASLLLAFASSNASPVWPPSGLALAALLLGGSRLAPGVLIGAFAANLSSFLAAGQAGLQTALAASALIACGNLAEAWLGSWLLRRGLRSSSSIASPSDVYVFAAAAMGAALLSASVGVVSLVALGLAPTPLASTIWFTWWLGDVTGILVLSPLLLALRRPQGISWRQGLEALPALLVFVLAACLSFGGLFSAGHLDRLIAFSLLGSVVLAALRHGVLGAALSSFGVAALAVPLTLAGEGPFAKAMVNDSLVSLDVFLAICAITGLVVAGSSLRAQALSLRAALRTEPLPVGLLMLALVGTVCAWHFVALDTERRAAERFEAMGQEIRLRMAERMAVYEQALRGARGLFDASKAVTADEWASYVRSLRLSEQFQGAQGLGFALWLGEPGDQARLQQLAPALQLAPQAGTPQAVVALMEPQTERNLRAIGFDLFSEPVRRAALQRAGDSGNTAMSGRVQLRQEIGTDVQAGFLLVLPVYAHGSEPATPAQRRAALQGFVYAPVRVGDLMHSLLRGAEQASLQLSLYDGVRVDAQAPMFATPSSADYPHRLRQQLVLRSAGHDWTLLLQSTPAFEAEVDTQKAQIALIAGALISLLLFSVVRALTQTREEALALAERLNRARDKAEQRFSSLAETARDAMFVVSGEGVIEVGNRAAARLCALPAEQLTGLPVHRLLELPPSLEEWLGGGHSSSVLETRCLRAGQPALPVEVALGAWNWEGRRYYSLIARDISLRRRAEAELRAAVQQAEQASRAKSQFLANMSHEIRTPMNAVLGLGYLLARSPLQTGQRSLVERIQLSARSLLGVINDILDLTKIEAGELAIVPEAFSLAELLQELRELMEAQAQAKGITLQIAAAPGLPMFWVGDALRLRQMLINLLSNAIKFTERGGVELSISGQDVGDGRWRLRVTVSDSGIGIPAEAQARLFEPFVQADGSATRRFGGTGLGLSIVKRLAELMGGRVGLLSEAGVGSEFWFELDLPVASGAAALPPVQPAQNSQHGLQGLHLLVVDDSELNLDVARHILELEGASVETAANGELALQRLQGPGRVFDLVLMDIQMPVMDGRDATRRLRADPALAGLPVIALTAGALKHEREAALEAGMNDFITKPFEPAELVATILRQVGGRERPARSATTPRADDWPAELQGFAIAEVCARLGGDAELFSRLLGRLVGELQLLEQARFTPPDERASQWHRLRGMAANLGALELARLAGAAEAACRAGDAAAIAAAEPPLQIEMRRVGDSAAAWVAAQDDGGAPSTAGRGAAPDAEALQRLIALLQGNNLAALQQFRDLAQPLAAWLGDASFRELDALAAELRFEELATRLQTAASA